MGIKLHEDVTCNARSKVKPAAYTVLSRQIVGRDLAHFNSGHNTSSITKANRTGNHQKIALRAATDGGFDATIIGLRLPGCSCAPVDLIDDVSLCRRWNRRHGEVGIAAQIAQQFDLSGQAAIDTDGVRVIKRPVAVNETEDHLTIVIVKQTMIVAESAAESANLPDKGFSRLAIMVNMNLDVANLLTGHLGQGFEQLVPVLLFRIKETVARLSACGITRSGTSNARPCLLPPGDPLQSCLRGTSTAKRFIVVGNRNPEALRFRASGNAPCAVAQIGGKP